MRKIYWLLITSAAFWFEPAFADSMFTDGEKMQATLAVGSNACKDGCVNEPWKIEAIYVGNGDGLMRNRMAGMATTPYYLVTNQAGCGSGGCPSMIIAVGAPVPLVLREGLGISLERAKSLNLMEMELQAIYAYWRTGRR